MLKNEILRQQRLKHNWRLADVAEQVGTALITVQRWERGIQQPSLYYRSRLCALFGLSVEELGFAKPSFPLIATRQEGQPANVSPDTVAERLWSVPYMRNPHFTGRDDLLTRIQQAFATDTAAQACHQVCSITSLALTGLSGVGKTQIAVEYAYRVHEQERSTHILWMTAASEGTILTSFVTIANLLSAELVEQTITSDALVAHVLHWFEQNNEPWLLIIDNADDLQLVQAYLPRRGNGRLLFTTQASAVGALTRSIEVECMDAKSSTQLLLRRTQLLDNAPSDEVLAAQQVVLELAQFPLALDQAGAYIEETGCSIATYLQRYQDHRQHLLTRRGTTFANHPIPVATTWSYSFHLLEQRNPAATQLLRLCAFLSPHPCPEAFIIQAAAFWPSELQQALTNPIAYDQLFQDLLAFSLVKRLPTNQMISVHRLVQIIQIDQMDADERYLWAKQVVCAMHTFFPLDLADVAARAHCLRYLGQVEAYTMLMQQPHLETAALFEWASSQLITYKLYHIAEPLLQKALQICEQQAGLLHPDTIQCLSNLAFLCRQQKQDAKAHLLSAHFWESWLKTSNLPHPDPTQMQASINALFADANIMLTQQQQQNLTHLLTCSSAEIFPPCQRGAYKNETLHLVRTLHAQGVPIREIARNLGLSRNTVRKYIRTELQPVRRQSKRPGILDPYKAQIRRWIIEGDAYNTKEMFMRLRIQGYTGSISTLKAFVHTLRRDHDQSPPPSATSPR